MGRLFKDITEELKIGLSVHAISKLDFPRHFGNNILKQFTLKNKIFIKESYM